MHVSDVTPHADVIILPSPTHADGSSGGVGRKDRVNGDVSGVSGGVSGVRGDNGSGEGSVSGVRGVSGVSGGSGEGVSGVSGALAEQIDRLRARLFSVLCLTIKSEYFANQKWCNISIGELWDGPVPLDECDVCVWIVNVVCGKRVESVGGGVVCDVNLCKLVVEKKKNQ